MPAPSMRRPPPSASAPARRPLQSSSAPILQATSAGNLRAAYYAPSELNAPPRGTHSLPQYTSDAIKPPAMSPPLRFEPSSPGAAPPPAKHPFPRTEQEIGHPPPSSPARRSGPAPASPAPRTPEKPRRPFSSPPASPARSTPRTKDTAAARTRQCYAITANSKRCTRMVSLAAWLARTGASQPSSGAEDSPDRGAGTSDPPQTAARAEPVFCRQHAKLALVESGFFQACASRARGTESEERWIQYADWIDSDLPVETQALLRHYMASPVSDRDGEGYIYVHDLVPRPRSSFPSRTSLSNPMGQSLNPIAHIKLGRTTKPVARLSQWRSSCPSREPIVRFVFPRQDNPTAKSATTPGQGALRYADRGTRNHHRWERMCLVELAGRAVASDAANERCPDCGVKHVECFLIDRRALDRPGGGSWSVQEIVEKWERWCRDVLV